MKFIYATYNQYCNSIDITTFDNILLRIDCNKAEDGLKTTLNSQGALNALAIDEPLEYVRLVLDGEMKAWIDAEDLNRCKEVIYCLGITENIDEIASKVLAITYAKGGDFSKDILLAFAKSYLEMK